MLSRISEVISFFVLKYSPKSSFGHYLNEINVTLANPLKKAAQHQLDDDNFEVVKCFTFLSKEVVPREPKTLVYV